MAREGRKFCPHCQRERAESMFGANRSEVSGKNPYCKECANEIQAEWKRNNPHKVAKWKKAAAKRRRAAAESRA